MCIVVRNDKQLNLYANYLREKNIKTYKLKRSASEDREFDGIRIATMHRVKGLEFDYVLLAGINDGIVPLKSVIGDVIDNVTKREIIISEKSLLYIAATRAKNSIFIT